MNYCILLAFLSCLWVPALASTDSVRKTKPSVKNHMMSIRHTWYTSDYILLGQHFGTADYKNKGYPLGVALSYGRSVGPRNYLSATLSYERQTGGWNEEYMGYSYKYGMSAMNYPIGNFTRNSLTLAAEYTHAYRAGKHFRLYTTVGAGITAWTAALIYDDEYYNYNYPYRANQLGNIRQQKTDAHFNGYYSPLGLSVGGNLSWFAEFGFGYKGLMNSGVSYIF